MSMNEMTSGLENSPDINNKVMPVMREAITMVQMILYKKLVADIALRENDLPSEQQRYLAGAVVNNLFGTEPVDEKVTMFARKNRELVEGELRSLHDRFSDLCPQLTDALRMKAICDNQEGVHSIPSLLMAKALNILHEDRALPMPSTFMLSVRALATKNGLVEELKVASPEE